MSESLVLGFCLVSILFVGGVVGSCFEIRRMRRSRHGRVVNNIFKEIATELIATRIVLGNELARRARNAGAVSSCCRCEIVSEDMIPTCSSCGRQCSLELDKIH